MLSADIPAADFRRAAAMPRARGRIMIDLNAIVAKLKPHSVYQVPPGEYAGDVRITTQGLTLQATPGTVTIHRGHAFGIKIEADDTTLIGLACSDNNGNGVFVARANGGPIHRVTLRDLVADRNGNTGILSSNVHEFTVTDCRCRDQRGQHGLYASQHGSGYRISGGEYTRNPRTGIHLNAHPGGASDVVIEGADCRGNPTASIQAAGVRGGKLARNLVGGGRADVILWTDNAGGVYACFDWDCTEQPGVYQVSKWCTGIALPPGVKPSVPEGG